MPTIPSSAAGGGVFCFMIAMFAVYAAIIIYLLILLTRFVKAHESIATSVGRIADQGSARNPPAFGGGLGPASDTQQS